MTHLLTLKPFVKPYRKAVAFVERVFEATLHKPYRTFRFKYEAYDRISLKYSGLMLRKT